MRRPHHAAVEVLLHLAEGVRRRLAFARDDDADVGDGQGGVRLAVRRSAVRDVDSLGGVAADVGGTTSGRGLDEVAALLQPLLPLIQDSAGREITSHAGADTTKNTIFYWLRDGGRAGRYIYLIY